MAYINVNEHDRCNIGGAEPPQGSPWAPRALNSSHYVTRGQRKLKKALCLPIYQPRYVKLVYKMKYSRKLSISRSKMGGLKQG